MKRFVPLFQLGGAVFAGILIIVLARELLQTWSRRNGMVGGLRSDEWNFIFFVVGTVGVVWFWKAILRDNIVRIAMAVFLGIIFWGLVFNLTGLDSLQNDTAIGVFVFFGLLVVFGPRIFRRK